jgi:hypothetical protein
MRKVYVRDGKSRTIIDVDKLSQTLGGELSLNYGQFIEAATNFFKFQSSRDKDRFLVCSESSQEHTVEHITWTESWRGHFAFFENQYDAERFYDFWKHMEYECRQERRRHNYGYDADHYKLKYTMAKNNALQREEVDKV